MFEEDMASTGILTVADLRKRIKGVPGNTVVALFIEGYSPAPIMNIEHQPGDKDEGETGLLLLGFDPMSEIGQAIKGDGDIQ